MTRDLSRAAPAQRMPEPAMRTAGELLELRGRGEAGDPVAVETMLDWFRARAGEPPRPQRPALVRPGAGGRR